MKVFLGIAALTGGLALAVELPPQLGPAAPPSAPSEAAPPAKPAETEPRPDWSAWTRPLGADMAEPPSPAVAEAPLPPPAEIDVVDAHWMALTMWGEARSHGEAGMRAVGHVIANRWRAGRHGGYVTDTVSQAYQFSCWNPGDPNLAAIQNIYLLDESSHDHLMWLTAKRVAAEILAGQSTDPTGGALFYHTDAVAPAWSRDIAPVRRIGNHLFFLAAR